MENLIKTEAVDWAAVRLAYDTRELTILEICKQFGITPAKIRYRREGEGWINRRARVVQRADLINRMLKILERQICKLEEPMTDGIDKSIQMLSASSKTLDKLIELRKDAEPNAMSLKEEIRNREKLVKLLDERQRR